MAKRLILVTGATGYVGGRLIPMLLDKGYRVRACARSIDKLRGRAWANNPNVELVKLDALDSDSFAAAAQGCYAAYYLIHSMGPQTRDFAECDRRAATNMVHAAELANLHRIIYLGGLGESKDQLSKHLRSRAEVSDILRTSSVPTTVLRAAMIIGSGSASFESLRYLVDRLPLMVTPRWVSTPSQPIAIADVLFYLINVLEKEEAAGQVLDIGGPEVVTYRQLMEVYAQEAGLPRRRIIPVPVFTPKLSSYWIHLVTPVPAYIAQPLAEGLRNPALCTNDKIKALLPHKLLTCREAIQRALRQLKDQKIETHWTDAGISPPAEWLQPHDASWAGGTIYEDKRSCIVAAEAGEVWRTIASIGGQTGWYFGNWLWRARGAIDRLIGGVGLRRGRRHPSELMQGDALDFWRVAVVIPPRQLLLKAEMKVPGDAYLGFDIEQLADGKVKLSQIARFIPTGLFGILYWYLLLPVHKAMFAGMLTAIARASER